MSTEHTRKCNRVDARMAMAMQMLEMWIASTQDGRLLVMSRAKASSRILAAIVHSARTPKQRQAVSELCERIARERLS
jgi:hypothetical protein